MGDQVVPACSERRPPVKESSTIPVELLVRVHKDCHSHRALVERSKTVGCFYCRSTFAPEDIKEWIDKEQTALCPLCGIDSVLPDSVELSDNWSRLLDAMHDYWFQVLK